VPRYSWNIAKVGVKTPIKVALEVILFALTTNL